MIIGLGVDIVSVSRMEFAMEKISFREGTFSARELAYIDQKAIQTAAGLFAAKEAGAKALGTGFRGFRPNEVEIARDALGRPYYILHGGAKARLEVMGGKKLMLNISHEQDYAVAVALVESEAL